MFQSHNMSRRTLHAWEVAQTRSNIGLAIVLRAKISPIHLKHAFRLTKKEHPYLRMVIESQYDGSKAFVEKPDIEMQLMCFPDGDGESFEWQDELQMLVNTPRNHNESTTYFEWYPNCMDGGRHVLLVVMNHAGADGKGVFQVFHSFCGYLGSILSGNDPPEPESREFADIIGRSVVPDFGKTLVPEDAMPRLDPQQLALKSHQRPGFRAFFKDLSEEMTTRLIDNSRAKGFTIQGALSASVMLAMAKVQEDKHPLPQKISHMLPVDMRRKVDPPVDERDCVCGVSGVYWWQEIQPSHTLTEVVVHATKLLHEKHDQNLGMAFWHWYQTEGWMTQYTVVCTSVGINPIQTQYGDVEVSSVDIMQGSYENVPCNKPWPITHIHTFAGRFRITKEYTWPATSSETVQRMLKIECACLDALSGASADNLTVGEFFEQVS